MTNAMRDYGRADLYQARLGLTPEIGVQIAAIISFAGAIEHFLERALWRMRGINPKGIKPDTDAKMITDLIGMLEKIGAELPIDRQRVFAATWCDAARSAFIIRHNIAHGVPLKMGSTLAYMRNPRWEGEKRKREFGDLWADPNTLELVRDAMATLCRPIADVASNGSRFENVVTPEALRAIQTARSVLSEIASQNYHPGFEKY